MKPGRIRHFDRTLRFQQLEHRELLAAGDFLREIADPSILPQSASDFGYALAASDDQIAVGAPGDDGAGMFNRGSVHLYDRATGSLLRSIDSPSPATGDRFGEALALSGTTLAVGAKSDDAGATDSGIVYLFDVTTGLLRTTIPNPTPAPFDYFGHSVAIEGDTVFVGAYLDDTFEIDAGIVHAFDLQTGVLRYSRGSPNPAQFEYFGFDVAVSNGRLAVAAHRADAGAVDSGAVFVFDAIQGIFQRQINNPAPNDFDYFGYSIDLSDTVLAVGAYRDDTGAANAGSAYTFDVTTGNLQHAFHNPQPQMADDFGFAVALAADSLIVGAYRDNAGANDAGSAYQFGLATGQLLRIVANPTPATTDYFGAAVAASGGAFFVGAYWDDTGALDAGAAYWYDATNGELLHTLLNPSLSSFNYFGHAVAVSGNWMAVGAHLDDAGGTDSGTVYLYDASTGLLERTIANPTPAPYDNFGYSLSMAGGLLAVGAHRDDAGAMDAGVVYVFDVATGTLLRTLLNPNPAALDYFGYSVSISGDSVAVGANRDDVGAMDAGAVYLFDVSSGSLTGTITNPAPAVSDQFGSAIALHESQLVVGAPQKDEVATNVGAAYLFDITTASLLHTLTNPLPVAGDYFGYAVAIYNHRVIVGTPQSGSGSGSGITYIFDTDSATLIHTLLDPEPAAFNQFGSSVALSGKWAVVGAPGVDTGGSNAGRASLFDVTSGQFERDLAPNSRTAGDLFGSSVTLDYEFLGVGAPQVDGPTTDRGAVSVFESRVNAAPLANAGGPYQGTEGTAVLLDASATLDDRDPTSELDFEWDLNYDGMAFDADAQGITTEVTFPNNFPVRQIAVRVTDTEGLSSIATADLLIDNVAPTLTIVALTVNANEGDPAANSGTYFDPGDDIVSLTTSIGMVADNGDGTWTWSLDVADVSTTVVITGTDDDGDEHFVTFELVVVNSPPTVSIEESTITVDEGAIASNSGTYFDPGVDPVVLTSSIGIVIDHGDGTWSWSLATGDGPDDSAIVTITATDQSGAAELATFDLQVLNVAPSITVTTPTVNVLEGEQATNDGTYFDPGDDVVLLTSSLGSIVDHGNGTWSWVVAVAESSQTVSITGTDDDGANVVITFALVVENVSPSITVIDAIVTAEEGTTATNAGAYFDPGADSVILASSIGTIVDHGDGTWSWSLDVLDGPGDSTTVTITVTDQNGAFETELFDLVAINVAPSLSIVAPIVMVPAGTSASNSGTYFDPGDDVVSLTSSIGSVVDLGNGTWSWSLEVAEISLTVTITGTDSDGAEESQSFELMVGTTEPIITVNNASVTVDEGMVATNSGLYFNPGIEPVLLTSSLGTVVDGGNGTWTWNLDTHDGPDDSALVEVIVTDSNGASRAITFQLIVRNVSPTLTVDLQSITILAGETAVNGGSLGDPGDDLVTLTSSVGTVTDHGDGTWTWSMPTTDGPDDSMVVTITATDEDGAEHSISFALVDNDLVRIVQIVVGDGTPQRSLVTKLEVQFDTVVEIDPGAFHIDELGGAGGTVFSEVTTTVVDGRSIATLTFSGSYSEVTGSLVDGRYRLTIDGQRVRRAGSTSLLDADDDGIEGGIRIFGDSPADRFFRLFGDVDGDYDVDGDDRSIFRLAMGSSLGNPQFDPRFDVDGDGNVDEVDRQRFMLNFRRFAMATPRDVPPLLNPS